MFAGGPENRALPEEPLRWALLTRAGPPYAASGGPILARPLTEKFPMRSRAFAAFSAALLTTLAACGDSSGNSDAGP